MSKRSFPLSRVHRLLEPGPVVLVTTACEGRANIMAMSWHTMMEFEPPLVGCVISSRNHTFDTLNATLNAPDRWWKAEEILDAAFARGFALAHP